MDVLPKIENIVNSDDNIVSAINFFDVIKSGLIILEEGRISYVNDTILSFIDIKKEEIINKSLYDVNPSLDFHKSKEGFLCTCIKIGDKFYMGRSDFHTKDNKIYQIVILNKENLYENFILKSSFYNKLSMELVSLLESTPDIVYLIDKNGFILSVNSVFLSTFNLEKVDVFKKGVKELNEKGVYPESVSLLALEQKKTIVLTQEIYGNKYMVSSYPSFDEEGNISFVVTKIRDMAEIVKIKSELDSVKKLSTNYYNELKILRNRTSAPKNLIAQSTQMKNIIDTSMRIAEVDATVIVNGESGTGKEVVAKLIHNSSHRKDGPFVKINCGAIPENLLESELFGYEKGAFTGAKNTGKAGLFEIANKGTLLLDEIGDMPLSLQVKLLRVLQENEFYPLGGIKPIKIDVRIIVTTHRDLKKMVKENTFREDLYYRLNVIKLYIPSLRDRKEDIIPLIYHFLKKYNDKYGLNKTISAEIVDPLVNGIWPGNIRELENTIERLVVLSSENTICEKSLPPNILLQLTQAGGAINVGSENISLDEAIGNYEKELILTSYHKNNKNILETARELNVHRTTILRKLKKYDIS